jgi:hypothetical protein
MQLPFSSYQRHVPNVVQRLVNVFAEQNPITAKGPFSLLRSPGIRPHKDVGIGPGRGLHVYKNKLYAVSGSSLYRVGSSSVETIGTIPGFAPVSMAENGIDLCVVTNPDGYFSDGLTVAKITDSNFTSHGATMVDAIDGYFVYVEPNSGRWFCSNLLSRVFNASKFTQGNGAMFNKVVGLIVNLRQVTVLGPQDSETWWDSGAGNFPFEAMQGSFYEVGALGGLSRLDNTEFCYANDRTVRRLVGNVWQRISTHGTEEKFRTYTSIPSAFTFKSEGHEFYVLRFTEATWIYDATTQEWAERDTYPAETWRVVDIAELNGLYYAQDAETGKVGIIDPAVFDEWGETLRVEWTYPNVYQGGRWIFHNRFELIIKSGVGLITGQGSLPGIVLQFSDDGGMTWTTAPSRHLGAIGQYTYRVFWTGLGRSKDRVYRCYVSDPVQVVVMDTQLETEVSDL